jgi:hypothetical protein
LLSQPLRRAAQIAAIDGKAIVLPGVEPEEVRPPHSPPRPTMSLRFTDLVPVRLDQISHLQTIGVNITWFATCLLHWRRPLDDAFMSSGNRKGINKCAGRGAWQGPMSRKLIEVETHWPTNERMGFPSWRSTRVFERRPRIMRTPSWLPDSITNMWV